MDKQAPASEADDQPWSPSSQLPAAGSRAVEGESCHVGQGVGVKWWWGGGGEMGAGPTQVPKGTRWGPVVGGLGEDLRGLTCSVASGKSLNVSESLFLLQSNKDERILNRASVAREWVGGSCSCSKAHRQDYTVQDLKKFSDKPVGNGGARPLRTPLE